MLDEIKSYLYKQTVNDYRTDENSAVCLAKTRSRPVFNLTENYSIKNHGELSWIGKISQFWLNKNSVKSVSYNSRIIKDHDKKVSASFFCSFDIHFDFSYSSGRGKKGGSRRILTLKLFYFDIFYTQTEKRGSRPISHEKIFEQICDKSQESAQLGEKKLQLKSQFYSPYFPHSQLSTEWIESVNQRNIFQINKFAHAFLSEIVYIYF